jgi:hypothetical protein
LTSQILNRLSNKGIRVKVLTPIDQYVQKLILDYEKQKEWEERQYQKNGNYSNNNNNKHKWYGNSSLEIQNIAPSSSINSKIIVVDNRDSVAMEIKDSLDDTLDKSIGLSTFSNSK